jgi:hypothetical protein
MTERPAPSERRAIRGVAVVAGLLVAVPPAGAADEAPASAATGSTTLLSK